MSIIHLSPTGDSGETSCCSKPVLELSHLDRMTNDREKVTCGRTTLSRDEVSSLRMIMIEAAQVLNRVPGGGQQCQGAAARLMDASTLMSTRQEDQHLRRAVDNTKRVIQHPKISILRVRKRFAIFDGFNCIRDFQDFLNGDEVITIDFAKDWIKRYTTVKPEVLYPSVTCIAANT